MNCGYMGHVAWELTQNNEVVSISTSLTRDIAMHGRPWGLNLRKWCILKDFTNRTYVYVVLLLPAWLKATTRSLASVTCCKKLDHASFSSLKVYVKTKREKCPSAKRCRTFWMQFFSQWYERVKWQVSKIKRTSLRSICWTGKIESIKPKLVFLEGSRLHPRGYSAHFTNWIFEKQCLNELEDKKADRKQCSSAAHMPKDQEARSPF